MKRYQEPHISHYGRGPQTSPMYIQQGKARINSQKRWQALPCQNTDSGGLFNSAEVRNIESTKLQETERKNETKRGTV